MSKQLSDAPLRPDERQATPMTTGSLPPVKKKQPAIFWPWFGGLLVVGLVIVGIVTFSTWNWLNSIQSGINAASPPSTNVLEMNVQRSISYADLTITLVNTQYAPTFNDDLIHSGPATVRMNLTVANPTKSSIDITYYDIARLLLAKLSIAPDNLTVPGSVAGGKTVSGWIDFPVAKNTSLKSLKLQLGNAAIHETLVTIPVSGSYNAAQYNEHTYKQSMEIIYYYKDYYHPGYNLTYHLNSVDVRYSYSGVEAGAGKQFYVLNFTIDNPNGVSIDPGTGYDYVRLRINGSNLYPMDSSMPTNLKANSQNNGGHTVYLAAAGMRSLNLLFLRQNVAGWDSYWITY